DITFFTDAKNDKGFEYVPETRTMTPNIKVKLNAPIYDPIMTMTKYVPLIGAVAPMDTSDLLLGYLDAEATAKAVTLTFKNNGNTNLHNPTIEIVAPYHTAHDGSSLNDAIQVALAAALAPDATKGPYLAPGDEFQVKARLNTGLGVGTYTGAVRFDADNVPPAMIKPIPFSVNVVRIMLPAPELATDPAGLSETNAPVEVEATFIRPVTGMTDADIQCTGGTVSGMTPVGASPAEKWRFTVTPQVGLESGQFIQLYAKQNIAYDSHGIRTDERSNALGMKYNTDRPYATFYFPYDITADSVFVTAQNRFTFTIEANGGSGTDADSLWEDTGVSFMDMSFVTPSVTMEKDGAPFSSFSVAAYEWDEATGAHTVTVTGAFDEGAYKVILAANRFRNNVGNLMEETVSGFNVRIPVILPGGSYPGPDIGYGIEPDPVTLPYPGGSVLLTVTGKNLQYARAMGILHIQMPPSLGSVLVEPNATAGGDTATFRVTLPGNSTVTTAAHPFTLLLNGSMPDPDAIGYTRVAPAPTIAIDPLPDKWFGMCEYLLTATIPDNGAAREVTITYLGLAKDYLAMPPVNARPPVRVTLESGETQLPPIPLRTLRVPDGQEAGTGAIVISSPGLPNDTSVWFQFYNTPNVDNMVYYAPTTMYPGLLELNIRGGSPSLERSFNGVTWENAWLPVTPLQISNLESGVIYFREPDGCEDEMHLHLRGFQGGEGIAPPQITREIQLTQQANILTDPAAGMHWVNSGRDFAFTVTLTGPSSGMWPEVTTSRQLMSDEEGVTVVPLGNDVFSVTVHHILEHFTIHIRAVENLSQDTEQVNGPRVWTTEGTVHIYATHPGEAYVYTLAGVPVKHFRLEGGRTNSTPLNAGFYVVVTLRDGQRYKIVIP
ncbi:MAG: hypothetical protein LBP50_04000, partial [Tannerella sp.]|nr:hypothetical protein [Tannerella sp.]